QGLSDIVERVEFTKRAPDIPRRLLLAAGLLTLPTRIRNLLLWFPLLRTADLVGESAGGNRRLCRFRVSVFDGAPSVEPPVLFQFRVELGRGTRKGAFNDAAQVVGENAIEAVKRCGSCVLVNLAQPSHEKIRLRLFAENGY